MTSLFADLTANSVRAVPAIVLVLIIRQWFFLPPRWQYGLWLIPMARLILPGSLTSITENQSPGLGHGSSHGKGEGKGL